MSIAERSTNAVASPPQFTQPQAGPQDGANADNPGTLQLALAPIRRRILARIFFRWYWICAAVADASALVAFLIGRPFLSATGRLAFSVSLLALPIVAAGIRCLAVRLPLPSLARMIDERGGLRERVASAVEASSSINRATPQPSPMLALLTRDALTALRSIDLARLLPLKRDAVLSALALAATLAFLFWHGAPLLIALPENNIGSQPVAVQQFSEGKPPAAVPAKSGQPVPMRRSPAGYAPPQSPKPSQPSSASHTAPKTSKPPQSANAGHTANGASSQPASSAQPSGTSPAPHFVAGAPPHAASNTHLASQSPTHNSGAPGRPHTQSHPTKTSNGAPAASRSQAAANPADQQTSRNHAASQTNQPPQRRSSTNQSKTLAHSAKQTAQSGSRSTQSTHRPQSSPGKQPGRQGQPNHSSQGQPQQSKPATPNSKQGNLGQNQSPSNPSRDAAAANNDASRAPTHPDSPLATGGHGKPPPIHPRDLAAVPNRSHFSFRLPRSTGGALKEIPDAQPQRSGLHQPSSVASKVPFGTAEAPTNTSSSAADISDIEQNPRIPAGYRNLVKQYFANDHASGRGRAH